MNRRTCQIIPIHIAHLNHIRPMALNRITIHNLVPLSRQPLRRLPLELAKVVGCGSVDAHVGWLAGRVGQTPHGGGNDLGGARVVLEIEPFDQVAVLLAVADGDVLVLLRVVFVGLDEAYAGVAGLEEGAVVAATAIPVQTIDEADGHLGEGVGRDLVDVAAKIAGRTVVVAADAEAGCCCCRVFGQGGTLTEEADVVRVACAVCCFGTGKDKYEMFSYRGVY
jgi:hypothetical protein